MPKFKYEKGGVSVPLNDVTVIELPSRLVRVRLKGLLFETDKAFLLPGAMRGIRGLVDFYKANPDMALAVTGHADRVGGADYNLGLSDERAESVAHYLQDDVDGWMRWYGPRPFSRMWSVREDQYMLASLANPSTGLPFYTSAVDGIFGSGTSGALRAFQEQHGLPASETPNSDARRALIREYMGLDNTSLPEDASVELLGCGEHHNEIPTSDHVEEPANRRVEVFCFHDGVIDPPVPEQCPNAGCPYLTWHDRMVETIDFDTELGELIVGVVEHEEEGPELTAIQGAQVDLSREGVATRTLHTPATGVVRFENLVPGEYVLATHKEGFDEDSQIVGIVSGGSALPQNDDEDTTVANGRTSSFAEGAPENDKQLFGDTVPATPVGSSNSAKKVKLKGAKTIIHIVKEIPVNLEKVAKEGVAQKSGRKAFERITVHPRWEPSSGTVIKELSVGTHGRTEISKQDAPDKKGVLTAVKSRGPHVVPLVYTMRDPTDSTKVLSNPPIRRGHTTKVDISARVRLSAWAFGAPLLKSTYRGITLDEDQLTKMQEARLDDLTLNYCMAPDGAKNWSGSGADFKVLDQRVVFTQRLAPGGLVSNTQPYVETLIRDLHAKGIQVLLGYTVGSDGAAQSPATTKFNRDFAAWLLKMTESEIDDHAQHIAAFVRRFEADGVGFDFETDQLKFAHRKNLQHLIRRTAVHVGRSNGVVSYATAPFTEDGKKTAITTLANKFQGISIQPYALAKKEKNLIARPMAFAAEKIPNTNPQRYKDVSFPDFSITQSLDYALKPVADGGVGLDPSQIQMAVFGTGLGVARTTDMCRDHFRPRRAGMMVYSLSQTKGIAETMLGHCKTWEAALNPGENPPGESGQPVQVPLSTKIPNPPKPKPN